MGTLAPHSFPGVGTAGENTGERELVGKPDGPLQFIPELGEEVGTFIDPCEHMRLPKDSGLSWLMHHVPMGKRGYYRLHQLPEDYRAEHGVELSQSRVDENGFLLCSSLTNQGTDCRRRAVNYSGKCQAHGGKLHPLDKAVDSRRTGMLEAHLNPEQGVTPGNVTSEATLARMTRWQHLLSGNIKVEDLDDEELARGMCRDASGGFSGVPPRMVPKDLHDRMVRELFQRADQNLRNGLIDVSLTMVEMATSPAIEPADRIKAATWVWERLRGKVADVVVHTQDKPWEMVLSNISGGSRAASRAARGVADEEELLEAQVAIDPGAFDPDPAATGQVVDAEVVEDYDPEDPLDNPSAGILDDEDPLDGITHERRYTVPPIDPEARQNHEWDERQAKIDEAKRKIELGKELKERREKDRRARYAARARGMTDLLFDGVPFERTATQVKGSFGPGAQEGESEWQHKFKLPKAPPKKRGNDDFRHTI